MVVLRRITKENLDEVLNLSVFEHQDLFVSSTAVSLAQAYVYQETAFPFAIYDDDTVVGFIMLGYYESKKQYTLWKFLIDKKYQNKGYGREALKQGVDFLKDKCDAKEIYTGVALGNDKAKKLYSSFDWGNQEEDIISWEDFIALSYENKKSYIARQL